MNEQELVAVGKISGTHGIKGLLKLYSYSGNIDSLKAAEKVFLKSKDAGLLEFTATRITKHSNGFIIGLEGFTDINQTEGFVGSELCLLKNTLPVLSDDEFYWSDLIGLIVLTDDGTELGTVASIFETGSNDIYVVKSKDKEYLIPAIADVIKSVDIKNGRMTITPLDGLLEL